jgi:hypothetical protein
MVTVKIELTKTVDFLFLSRAVLSVVNVETAAASLRDMLALESIFHNEAEGEALAQRWPPKNVPDGYR